AMQPDSILEINNLRVGFRTLEGSIRAVNDVSFTIRNGETLGLVGESGCGKSVTAHSILRLLPKRTSKIENGTITFRRRNESTVELPELKPDTDAMRGIPGNEITTIFQEPITSLSPMHTIANQIIEAIQLHQKLP